MSKSRSFDFAQGDPVLGVGVASSRIGLALDMRKPAWPILRARARLEPIRQRDALERISFCTRSPDPPRHEYNVGPWEHDPIKAPALATLRCGRSVAWLAVLGLLLAPFLGSRAASAQARSQAVLDLSPIVAQLRAQDPSGALAATRTQLHRFPHDCRLLSLEGLALSALHRPGDALQSFNRALSVCPKSLPALEGAAQLRFAAADPAGKPLLQRILELQPADPTSHAMLATLLGREGACSAAAPHFDASRALFPTQPALLLDYGICEAQLEHWPTAIAVFEQLATEHPSAAATRDLAIAQWRGGDPHAALATLEPLLATAAAPDASTAQASASSTSVPAMPPTSAILALGSTLAEAAGNTPRAVGLLRSAILAAPDEVENYLAFARLADAHQSFQVGIDMIDAGLTRLPHAAPLYLARGVLHIRLSQVPAGEADFQRAHSLDPQLSSAVDALGILETQQHQDAASLQLFREQSRLHPADPLLQYLLAEALSESPDAAILPDAIDHAKRAAALEPGFRPALDLLATLYLRTNQPAQVVEVAEQALTHDPNDSQALFAELRAQHKLGNTAAEAKLLPRLEAARHAESQQSDQLGRFRFTD